MSSSAHRTILLISVLAACLCMAYVAGFGGYQVWDTFKHQPDPVEPMEVFWEVWERVEEHFYGKVPSPTERTYGAIHESLLLLDDPYTVFVEPQPRELERDTMRGAFGGIGVVLWRNVDGQIILSPLPGSPAERGGIRDGDVLVAVDGEKITDDTTEDDVRAWLHGEVDTSVTLTISRPPTPPLDFTITRSEIQVPSVIWRVLDQAPDIGYVQIDSFTERTGDELAAAIQGLLHEEQVSSLLLDLRDNSGGLVEASISTASQFLHDGDVLIEQYRDRRERAFQVEEQGAAFDVPLAILVNAGTASASEIVAGALQDHARGPLIGESTFGKGSVQLIYDLSDGSSLHVTTAIWLTPNRNQIEGHGLTPDIYVASDHNPLHDEQLDRAIDYLEIQRMDDAYLLNELGR
jgi:carboxyl-terminal processing protease